MSWYPPSVWGYHLWNVFALPNAICPNTLGGWDLLVVQSYLASKGLLEGCTRARRGWPERDKTSTRQLRLGGLSSLPDATHVTRDCKKPPSIEDVYIAWRSVGSSKCLWTGLHSHTIDLFAAPGVFLWIPKRESEAFSSWTNDQPYKMGGGVGRVTNNTSPWSFVHCGHLGSTICKNKAWALWGRQFWLLQPQQARLGHPSLMLVGEQWQRSEKGDLINVQWGGDKRKLYWFQVHLPSVGLSFGVICLLLSPLYFSCLFS